MAQINVRGKMAAFEAALPGFAKLWKQIKDTTETKVRAPKSITFTDVSSPMYLSDGYIGKRYALDLETMAISPSVHVSSGEWSAHGGSNNDRGIVQIPNGKAVVDCEFNDYYRVFSLTIVVAQGALPKQIAA